MNPFVRARNLLAAQLTPRRIGDPESVGIRPLFEGLGPPAF